MTKEDKQLLLKDLCTRLPYGIMIYDNSHKNYGNSKLINIGIDGSILIDNKNNDIQYYPIINEIKPYLRPMSSMTKEEKSIIDSLWKENNKLVFADPDSIRRYRFYDISVVDFLNKHHFDYRGLIKKGLALKAKRGMYKIE